MLITLQTIVFPRKSFYSTVGSLNNPIYVANTLLKRILLIFSILYFLLSLSLSLSLSLFLSVWRCGPTRGMASSFLRFLDHTQRRITVGRNPLDAWSVRRRDLCLTTHNIHNRQTSMPPVGFEPTITAGERPETYALDRAATETDSSLI